MANTLEIKSQLDLIVSGHKFFNKDQWFPINSNMAKHLSQEAAIIFGLAFSVENYMINRKIKFFKKNGYKFILENNYIQNKFPYSAFQIRKGFLVLEEMQFINVCREGYKNKRVISINWAKVISSFLEWNIDEIENESSLKDEIMIDEMNDQFFDSVVNSVNHSG